MADHFLISVVRERRVVNMRVRLIEHREPIIDILAKVGKEFVQILRALNAA